MRYAFLKSCVFFLLLPWLARCGMGVKPEAAGVPASIDPSPKLLSVIPNGDYIGISATNLSSGIATMTTNGVHGFTAGNTVVVAGYTGADAGYNGTYTLLTASETSFTYATSNVGMANLTFNTLGYAISLNTTSGLLPGIGNQASIIASIAYTFDKPVALGSGAITLGLQSGVTSVSSNNIVPATNVPDLAFTSPDGGSTWVLTFVTGNGHTVTGHSISDGVYTLTVDNTKITSTSDGLIMSMTRAQDVFYRLFADGNADLTVDWTDYSQKQLTFGRFTGVDTQYDPVCEFNGDGRIVILDSNQNHLRLSTTWSGFTPTL